MIAIKLMKNLQLALRLQIFFYADKMFFFRQADCRDERQGDNEGGDQESVLQGVVLGDGGFILFVKVVGVDELMHDPEDGDADGAAELLEEAVHRRGG